MNCQSCNARVDYRFVTSCAYCDSKVEASGVSQIDPIPALQGEKRSGWTATLINIAYTLATSSAGMISGVVAAYCLFAVAYQIFFSVTENMHRGCGGPETLIGMLLICSGAYLGAVGGAVFAVKRPLCKGAAN